MSINDPIGSLYQAYLACRWITIDSRNVVPNSIFFALKGPSFDGNAFAEQALNKGALYAVIDNVRYKKDHRYILVEDTLSALQGLAQYHRKKLKIPVVAITGSSGKTTTKELIQAVLSTRYVVAATPGNLNNHIGVPLTILTITSQTELAIVEMGASHLGEIAQLCQIAMPTHGLITNIGHVHLEGFGSLEGVIKGKSELYGYLHKHNGVAFVNSADPILCRIIQRFLLPITYPQKRDFYHCRLVKEGPFVVYQSEQGKVITSHLLGKFHFFNIASALCMAKYFGVEEKEANKAVQAYLPRNNRSQVVIKGSNTILLDAYNANLESTKGVIQALHLVPVANKVLILGDMAELGDKSEEAHRALGYFTTQANYGAILLCGPCMAAAKEANVSALHFPQKESLEAYLRQKKFKNTAFLIKGSHFLNLQTLVEVISSG